MSRRIPLKRWGISEDQLPPAAIVRFKQPIDSGARLGATDYNTSNATGLAIYLSIAKSTVKRFPIKPNVCFLAYFQCRALTTFRSELQRRLAETFSSAWVVRILTSA
jgi:hypothetical protein